jgi:phosphatidylserine decarboxylase
MATEPIQLFNRQTGRLEQEYMRDDPTTYETRPRRSLKHWLLSHRVVDHLASIYNHTHRSKRKIDPFVRKYEIRMEEFEPENYYSFADFFVRRFRPGARRFAADPRQMPAFAEARYFGWRRLEPQQKIPVKGHSLSAAQILGDPERAAPYDGGPVLLARLSPMDYHRMHYPDDGTTVETYSLGDRTFTVNPRALRNEEDILFRNERRVNILQTEHFGRLAFVEVGALTVGKVAQVHPPDRPFSRGLEKAFFRFGGSAIVVFGEPGAWCPCNDLLEHTRDGYETLVQLGDVVAVAGPPAT